MKEKFFLLLPPTDDGADIRIGSINIYYGIRKKKDAEKPERNQALLLSWVLHTTVPKAGMADSE